MILVVDLGVVLYVEYGGEVEEWSKELEGEWSKELKGEWPLEKWLLVA
jgi:hypothetical protein